MKLAKSLAGFNEETTMKDVKGFGYKFGNELRFSFDPVIGGWPMDALVADEVEIVPVTRYEVRFKGERTSATKLIAAGALVCDDADIAAAGERAKADRARGNATRAAERARAAAEKAAERAATAERRAADAKKLADARLALLLKDPTANVKAA